jgi:hypothetical protein
MTRLFDYVIKGVKLKLRKRQAEGIGAVKPGWKARP